MTQQHSEYLTDEICLRSRIGLVALRLSIAVNQQRALRGDGREDRFAGVLIRDSDIASLCAQLIADPLPHNQELIQRLAESEKQHNTRCRNLPELPLIERVSLLYGLSTAEAEIFFICFAVAVDPRLGRVLAYLQEDMAKPFLTLGLAQRLLSAMEGGGLAALWASLSSEGSLIRHGLIEKKDGLSTDSSLAIPDWLVRLLLVGPDVQDRIDQLPHPYNSDASLKGPLIIEANTEVDAIISLGPIGSIWISHHQALSQILKTGILAALFGHTQIISDADHLPLDQKKTLVRSLGRHSVLISRRPALWAGFGKVIRISTVPPSSLSDRFIFWQHLVGPALNRPEFASLLSLDHSIPLNRLWRFAQEAQDLSSLALLLRHERSEPMQGLADPIPLRYDFDDLELPSRSIARLRSFAARRQGQSKVLEEWGLGQSLGASRGAIALLLGPSGTGKTMAASVMAKEAGLDLWRINLATTVSKYIGETEANLDRIFQAADKAEVMLFFDEAEALFSKRAEVKEARDRYANMEMAYLLQRIEDFQGMAVLASNMGTSLEPAMLRRFDLVLELTLPDASTRRKLWNRIETSQVPLSNDVDLDLLAERFELAGGHIRQAILSAAYEAVKDNSVTQMHLLRAVAREYVKLGRPLRKEDFGAHFAQMRGQP